MLSQKVAWLVGKDAVNIAKIVVQYGRWGTFTKF